MSREPVSPELVLVSPELAERARSALSDRPWEAFAPPVTAPPPRVIRIRVGTAASRSVPSPRLRPRRPHRGAARVVLAYTVVLALALSALTWAAERTPAPELHDAGPTPVVPPPAVPPAAAPDAVYAFAGGTVRIVAGRAQLTLERSCVEGARTPTVPVEGRAFRFAGRLLGSDVYAIVQGWILDPAQVSVRIELLGPTCPAGALDLTARLG